MARFVERVIGAAKLDVHTYEEVVRDQTALGQAMVVVVASVLAVVGVGALQRGIGSLVSEAMFGIIGWFVYAVIIYLLGTRVLPEPQTKAEMGQLLRALGFAASPAVLLVFRGIPVLRIVVWWVVPIWVVAATVIAVRQALDYHSTGRALGVCFLGWVLSFVAWNVLAWKLGLIQLPRSPRKTKEDLSSSNCWTDFLVLSPAERCAS
jgi:hypothetical protein